MHEFGGREGRDDPRNIEMSRRALRGALPWLVMLLVALFGALVETFHA